MTLRHLEIFRAVCAHQSVTKAAASLNLTQPAVSIAIRELETFYQAHLFERINRGIQLTADGQRLLQYANNIWGEFEESVRELRREDAAPRCTLGVNATIAESRLSRFIGELRSRSPEISLNVQVDNSHCIEEKLRLGQVDLAIIDEVEHPERWISEPLCTERMVIVAASDVLPADKSLTVEELSPLPLLLRESGSGSRKCVDAVFERHGVRPAAAAESISTLFLLSMAQMGLGAAIVPESVVHQPSLQHGLSAAELSGDSFIRTFYLLRHPQKYLTPAMDRLTRALRSFYARF